MIGLLLLLQVTSPAACGTPALCRLLEAAATANRAATVAPGGYRAIAETETATLGRWEGRIEGATLLEQTSSEVRWSSEEGFSQRVVGSRSFPNAIPLSKLAFMRIGWVVPTLNGQRLSVVPRNAPGQAGYQETLSGPLASTPVVHPLASDRDRFYRFSGGERLTRTVDGTVREVDHVEVAAVEAPPAGIGLFEGEMDLDPASHAVVRLKGRVRIGAKPAGRMSLSHVFVPVEVLVDLVSQRLPRGGWVPLTQRFEIQTQDALANGFGATRRVISRFYDARALPAGPLTRPGGSAPVYSLTAAPSDSLRRFHAWRTRAGTMTDGLALDDFRRFQPDRQQSTGKPFVMVQGYDSGEFYRLNRIEGLFTGASVIVPLRDRAPGLSLHATGGYAWWEHTVRGGLDARWTTGGWRLEGGVARSLDVTNDFRDQFDNPNLGALAGRDPWDYVDRKSAGVALARRLEYAGSVVRLEIAGVEDRAVGRNLTHSLLGRLLRDNRNITEGDYLRTRLLFDWNPALSPLVARDGIGLRVEMEHASGDLDYTRVEARVVVRRSFRPFYVMARLHAGGVFADTPPPQQLFELGGAAGFPGYEYKEFAGNRAVLFRTRISYSLPLLDTPLRIGSGLTLPALAPAVSFGFQSGLAAARSPAAQAAVRSLGDRHDDEFGAVVTDPLTGAALPGSVPADRLKTSIDVRVGIFGDALGVGLARALTPGRKTTFFVAIGRQF